MTKTIIAILILSIYVLSLISLTSAIILENVEADKIYPGQSASVSVSLKNNLNEDAEDVSLILNLGETQFTTSGSNEDSQDKVKEGKSEEFNFVLKASSEIKPGDYQIPYKILYTYEDEKKEKSGSFGIFVSAKTELSYIVETEKNVVGERGKVSLKIINSGLGDVRFVNVKISGIGFDLISNNEDYIGTVSSDDFEKASFDVIFKSENARLNAVVEYKDLENLNKIQNVDLDFKVYSREKGYELGIIQKSNAWIYGVVILVIIVWFVYRGIKKRRKKKNSGR